jgi:hypothetical protein
MCWSRNLKKRRPRPKLGCCVTEEMWYFVTEQFYTSEISVENSREKNCMSSSVSTASTDNTSIGVHCSLYYSAWPKVLNDDFTEYTPYISLFFGQSSKRHCRLRHRHLSRCFSLPSSCDHTVPLLVIHMHPHVNCIPYTHISSVLAIWNNHPTHITCTKKQEYSLLIFDPFYAINLMRIS